MSKSILVGWAALALICGCSSQDVSETPSEDLVGQAQAETISDENFKDVTLASVIMDETSGCLEGANAQFGRYLGDWSMTSKTLSRADGKTWEETGKARWNFTCVGNGVAVQDFWMPESGGAGTNLRMYNPKSESWDIAWTSTGTPGMSHINAKQDETGNIVMNYVNPIPNPLRRITFFPPDDTGWDWQLAISQDGGENWITVSKMRAEPHKP